jgi:hypothetical protein
MVKKQERLTGSPHGALVSQGGQRLFQERFICQLGSSRWR